MPDGARLWLVTRYEDARLALADARFSNRLTRGATSGSTPGSPTSHHMLSADPPDHTRLRRLVSAGFTARRVERLRPRIAGAGRRTARRAMSGDADLIDDVRLPAADPGHLRAARRARRPTATRSGRGRTPWSPAALPGTRPWPRRSGHRAEMVGYITELLADKRAHAGDDLLSRADQRAREEGDRLTENELVSMVFLLLVAGHETTVNLIGNGVLALLPHPDQLPRCAPTRSCCPARSRSSCATTAPCKQATYRCTEEPVEIGGGRSRRASRSIVALPPPTATRRGSPTPTGSTSAGRDAGHLAFGHGIHFCLGAAAGPVGGTDRDRHAAGPLPRRAAGGRARGARAGGPACSSAAWRRCRCT